MSGPFSAARFKFIEPGTTAFIEATQQTTVGDPIRFQIYPGCEPGGPPLPSFGNFITITALTCRVETSGDAFVLKSIEVFWSFAGNRSNRLPFYIRIFKEDPNGVLAVRPEWSSPHSGEYSLTQIDFYRAQKAGSASILAELIYPAGGMPDTAVRASMSVQVTQFPLRLTLPAKRSVRVGEETGPPFSVALPFDERFSTEARFFGGLEISDHKRSLRLKNLMRPPMAIGAPDTFDLRLTVVPGSDGWTGVFFQDPDPAAAGVLGHLEFDSFDNYMVGRKAGTCQIVCEFIVRDPERFIAPDGPVSFDVVVEPRALTLECSPAGAPGTTTIVMEDDWREDEQKLRAAIHVRVLRESTMLFDSAFSSVVQGDYSTATLNVRQIDRAYDDIREHATDRFNTSVQLRLTISHPDYVAFDVRGVATGSSFAENDAAWDWLSARHNTEEENIAVVLSCEIVKADETRPTEYPDDFVVYDVPQSPSALSIVIPAPLRAELIAWTDAHFPGLPLDQGNPTEELIYSSGTLDARVDNHRPESTSEQVKVIVKTPQGGGNETVLDPQQDLTAGGALQVEVGGFDYSEERGGTNIVTLWAWKPINDVENVPADRASVQLTAVPPRDYAILQPADGTTIRNRAITVEYRLARASSAQIDDNGTVEHTSNSEAYIATTRNTGQIVLAATPGDHVLRLRAINDFGDPETSITLHAPRPTIQVNVAFPDDRFRPPDEVGNSVKFVEASVTVSNCRELEIRRDGNVLESILTEASETRTVRLPPRDEDLAVGANDFELIAINDFGSRSALVTIRRRGKVFDGTATFTIEAVDKVVDGRAVVVEIAYVVDGATQPLETGGGIASYSLSGPADSAFLDWDGDDWQTYVVDDDGNAQLVSVDTIHRVGALLIGPDFQNTTILIEPEPGWIVGGGEQDESPIPGLFATVTLSTAAVTASGAEFVEHVAVNLDTLQRINEDGDPI